MRGKTKTAMPHSPGERRYLQGVYVLHLVIAAILIYVSLQYFRGTVGSIWYSVLMLLGFGALGYHGYWLLDSWRIL